MPAVLVANAAVTMMLVGLILTIQQVHYPLFSKVGAEQFRAYGAAHSARITVLVLPLMGLELALAAGIAISTPPAIPRWSALLGLALVLAIWLSTFFLQVPQHAILGRGWNAQAHATLVATNWLRTAAWMARGILSVWWLLLTAS